MTITLSTEDLGKVQACSQVLLSVLDDPIVDAWAQRVIECAKPLLDADRMFLAVPGAVRLRSTT